MARLALDHLQFAIPEGGEARARAFWCGVLGCEEIAKPAALAGRGGLWLALADGFELHLGVDPDFHPAAKAHPGFRVAGLDAALARLARAGIAAEQDLDTKGRRRAYLADPFGNRIELIEAA
jgi:catechol 2,3-dioxygenase-like lactoylglutathione lyase family enzyme